MSIFDWQVAFHYGFDAIYLQQKKKRQNKRSSKWQAYHLQALSNVSNYRIPILLKVSKNIE